LRRRVDPKYPHSKSARREIKLQGWQPPPLRAVLGLSCGLPTRQRTRDLQHTCMHARLRLLALALTGELLRAHNPSIPHPPQSYRLDGLAIGLENGFRIDIQNTTFYEDVSLPPPLAAQVSLALHATP
jgi:hypothetical protein